MNRGSGPTLLRIGTTYPRSCCCRAGSKWAVGTRAPESSAPAGVEPGLGASKTRRGSGLKTGIERTGKGWGWRMGTWMASHRWPVGIPMEGAETEAGDRWRNQAAFEHRCWTAGRSSRRSCCAWWTWRTVSASGAGAAKETEPQKHGELKCIRKKDGAPCWQPTITAVWRIIDQSLPRRMKHVTVAFVQHILPVTCLNNGWVR